MRLLHAKTLRFENFDGVETTPKYAILSHTWGDEEVTYEDMRVNRDLAVSKVGFQKIRGCALQTLKDGLEHFWIDTCCIDKSSSAELSEAINSMFKWYQQAEVCYAYLIDVPEDDVRLSLKNIFDFTSSRWFTRGWTLQELIAPRRLVFYVTSWQMLATREEIAPVIEFRAGIPKHVLHNPLRFAETSVAEKMSWASDRQTSRPEDLAYCLMGLFDVNMPMLYGEGEKAFIRLQEEIIRTSDDMSIFAWTDKNANVSSLRGLLAKSPSQFASCKDIHYTPQSTIPPYRTTNKGIEISVQLDRQEESYDEHIAWLHGVGDRRGLVGIYVKKVGEKQYARVDPNKTHGGKWIRESRSIPLTTLFVRQQIFIEEDIDLGMSRASEIFFDIKNPKIDAMSVRPPAAWNKETGLISLSRPLPTLLVLGVPSSDRWKDLMYVLDLELDTGKSWEQFLSASCWTIPHDPRLGRIAMECTMETSSSARYWHFGRNVIDIALRQELFDGELKLSLSITA